MGPSTKDKRRIRRALAKRQGLVCFYCDEPVEEPPKGTPTSSVDVNKTEVRYATIDHLRPLARGGTSSLGNMVLACQFCHARRHNG